MEFVASVCSTRSRTRSKHNSSPNSKQMAGRDELKLLGMWPSPFVHRVKFALGIKGLSYENIEEDLKNKSELLLASNPLHKVPVLIHNGKPVCESMIIVQYIDEAFASTGPSILPSDPYERAVARFWAAYVDDTLYSSWIKALRGKTDEEKEEGTKQTIAAVQALEGALKECSKGKGFFGGDSVGYVDIALGGFLGWVHATGAMSGTNLFEDAKTPLLVAWDERFSALDAAKAVIPDVDRLVEFAKMREAQAAAAAANS